MITISLGFFSLFILFRVSSDERASEDEDDDSDENGYDDSFINDGTDSAEASARADNSESGMMAFYR